MSVTNKAKPLNPLLHYLRFESKETPYFEYNGNKYSLLEIKQIIRKIEVTDPSLYRNINQIFNPTNPKVIANKILNIEKTTLLRNWEKASCLIMNRLVNKDVILPMKGIDVLKRDQVV